MPVENNEPRRPFQFRLATLILLMVIIALASAWWADHVRLMRQLHSGHKEIKVFVLQNLNATQVAASLQRLLPDSELASITIAVDRRTNSLIVSGTSAGLDEIEATLTRLDQSIRQDSTGSR